MSQGSTNCSSRKGTRRHVLPDSVMRARQTARGVLGKLGSLSPPRVVGNRQSQAPCAMKARSVALHDISASPVACRWATRSNSGMPLDGKLGKGNCSCAVSLGRRQECSTQETRATKAWSVLCGPRDGRWGTGEREMVKMGDQARPG